MEAGKPKILFADDEAPIRKIIGALINYICPGYEVLLAENGRLAYARFEEAKKQSGLALILTDLKMPDIDGVGFARLMRKNYPDDKTPLLALTGYSTNMLSKDEKAYFREILMKPISFSDLKEAIERNVQHNAA